VPVRALLTRSALALLVLAGGVLAAVGGVSLGVSGLVAVALVAVVAACLGAGIVRDGNSPQPRQAALDAAWRAAVGTVGVLLLLSGSAVLAGAEVTALLAGAGLGVALLCWGRRSRRTPQQSDGAAVIPLTGARPVGALSVEALGQEWLRTSAALVQARGTAAQQALVDRRQAALDELERRDPAGFARWLAGGPTVDSDPAPYVSGNSAAGYDAA
jgi:hypothetical protein